MEGDVMTTAVKTRSRTKRQAISGPNPSYLTLIRKFPLRPLRSEKDYDMALEILDLLAVRPEGSLDSGTQDYFDTLTLLVEAYDSEHYGPESRRLTPVQTLKHLMEESGMRTVDLGRLLGNRGLASMILRGRRQLSKTHIRKLSDHFKVSPALFFSAN
jgi:HTH-type transcriptional regulator / antitoxin HigA